MSRAARAWVLCLLAFPAGVSAQAPSPEVLFQRASEAMRMRRYDEAIALFLDSYRREPSPNALLNVALAYRDLGRDRLAMEFAQRYLDEAPADMPENRRAALHELLVSLRARLVVFTVRTTPADAALTVDGMRVWPHHGELVLDPGEHRISVAASGYRATELLRQTRAGESGPLVVTLQPESPAPAAHHAPPVLSPRESTQRPASQPPLYTRWWLWTGVALVVGAAVTAAVLLTEPSVSDRYPASVQINTLTERGER